LKFYINSNNVYDLLWMSHCYINMCLDDYELVFVYKFIMIDIRITFYIYWIGICIFIFSFYRQNQ